MAAHIGAAAIDLSGRPLDDHGARGGDGNAIAFWGLGIALATGALARFWNLSGQSEFLDEAFTFDAARRPLHDLLSQVAYHDAHPPLFYLATHALLGLHLPLSPEQYRFFTAPFGLLTIVATWAIARRLFGNVAAPVAAIVVALSPALVQLDRFYRMYALLTALTAVSWWLLQQLRDSTAERPARAAFWAYVATAALLPSLQYLGGAVVLAQAVYGFLTPRASAVRRATLYGAVAAAALLSWWVVWALPVQFRQGGYAGSSGASQTWWEVPAGALGYGLPSQWYAHPAFGISFAVAIIVVLGIALGLSLRTILPWYALPIVLQGALSAATGKDLLLSRYLVHLVPAFAVAVGCVVAALAKTPWRVAGLALGVAAVAVNGVAITNELVDPVYQTPDWNLVARILAENGRSSDAIVLDDGYPFLILRDKAPFANRAVTAPTQAAQVNDTIAWIDQRPHERMWYIENQYYYPDPKRSILAHLAALRPRIHQWLEPRADLSNSVYIALFDAVRGRIQR